ncbi:hypothetical protein LTR28_008341, partial [Elasticomyces elasticus]
MAALPTQWQHHPVDITQSTAICLRLIAQQERDARDREWLADQKAERNAVILYETYPGLKGMLNAKELNKVLTLNADKKLFPCWMIVTPNGTLLAYTHPANAKELRDRAALVSMAWKENSAAAHAKKSGAQPPDTSAGTTPTQPSETPKKAPPPPPPDSLETLTIEFDNRNLLVRYLQPKLLLVLEGGVPPRRKKGFRVTPEAPGDPVYPSAERPEIPTAPPSKAPSERRRSNGASSPSHQPDDVRLSMSAGSKTSKGASDPGGSLMGRTSVLQVHRRKLDAMAQAIRAEFEKDG